MAEEVKKQPDDDESDVTCDPPDFRGLDDRDDDDDDRGALIALI